MPTLFAIIVSAIVGYVPLMFSQDDLSFWPLMTSTMLSIITFAAIQWWLRRLRGDF